MLLPSRESLNHALVIITLVVSTLEVLQAYACAECTSLLDPRMFQVCACGVTQMKYLELTLVMIMRAFVH